MFHILRSPKPSTGKTTAKTRQSDDATVNQFLSNSVYYPDHPSVSFNNVAVGQMVEEGAATGQLNVAVVGRGASALGAMTELRLIADKNPKLKIEVTNYHYDTEIKESGDAAIAQTKWGRIFTVQPGGEHTNYQEIGCMRFPSIAQLTWKYIAHAYPNDLDKSLTVFPNPGRVLTQFVYRDINVFFKKDDDGQLTEESLDKDLTAPDQVDNWSMMLAVRIGVIMYLFRQYKPLGDDTNVEYFKNQLVNVDGGTAPVETMSDSELNAFWDLWERFKNASDVPLVEAVKAAVLSLVEADKIELSELRDLNYYIELFGRFGFGTGGFRPLNNVSLPDILRLLIWDYSDEYLFPVNKGDSASGNFQFAKTLYDKIIDNAPSNWTFNDVNEKVVFVGKRQMDGQMDVYTLPEDAVQPLVNTHDYVIIATAHHSAQQILEPFSNLTENFLDVNAKLNFAKPLGDIVKYATQTEYVHPLDQTYGATGKLYAGLKNLHMMRSTKYFTNVQTTDFDSWAPKNLKGEQVKMVISDTDLAASYFLPGLKGTTNVLVSYTWGDEASNESSRLRGLTQFAGSYNDAALRAKHAQATNRFVTDPTSKGTEFWCSRLLAEAKAQNGYMYDWTADQDSRGGFKLDWAGESPFTTALYRHNWTSVVQQKKANAPSNQKLFLAGDSVSHFGGWLEGAFHTSVTSVAGLIYSHFGKDVFTEAGQRIFMKPPTAAYELEQIAHKKEYQPS